MKLKTLILLAILLCVGNVVRAAAGYVEQPNPYANPQSVVTSGDVRFTVLTPEMIRIEWRSSSDKQFVDRATFAVINRYLPEVDFNQWEEDGFLYIKTEKLKLRYRIGANLGDKDAPSSDNLRIQFQMGGRTVTWYPWKKDNFNLKGTCRTLDGSNGDNKRSELEDGLVSRSGWAVIDDTGTRSDGSKSLLFTPSNGLNFDWVGEREDKEGIDWYFMGYGHDYKKALYDFTRIAGKIPMPPMYAFGYWYSKYQKYTEQDFKDLVTEMEQNDVPLDVMVVDTDWHINGWTGWSWNKELFPDPAGFLKWLHDKDLKVTLNLHPAYGVENNEDNYQAFKNDLDYDTSGKTTIDWNLENESFYKSLFKNILRPHEEIGVDFWWLDWQQDLLSKNVEGLGQTYWLNYVFFKDMEQTYPDKRAMIFHRWGGLGNHRYQIGFSGDSHSNFPTLAFQPYFTATASNVGYGYWGHDLGGHHQDGDNNPELYLRWIQFGVFSPLLRTHSSNAANIERRIWKYSNFNLMKDAFELRYALVPYIYNNARKAYDTGVSICRPLYYDNPETNEAYDNEGEYMFGDDILVCPVTKASDNAEGTVSQSVWLPEGRWYEACSGTMLDGGQTHTRVFGQADIPYYYKAGSVIPNYPKMRNLKKRPESLILKFVPGADGSTRLYEDENDTEGYKSGKYTFTTIEQQNNADRSVYTINPAEGSFDGQPTARKYVMELLDTNLPKSVKVNGSDYAYSANGEDGTWSYDDKNNTVVVRVPSVSCSERTEVVVEHDEDNLYIIGGAVSTGWDNGKAPRMTKTDDGKFVWKGRLKQGDFKFIKMLGTWTPAYTAPTENEAVTVGTSQTVKYDDYDNDYKFVIETAGWYEVTVDTQNNTMTVNEAEPVAATDVWMEGSAVPESPAKLEYNTQTAVLSYKGELQDGSLKFYITDPATSVKTYIVPATDNADILNGGATLETTNDEAQGWTVAAGRYEIKPDMQNNTVSAIRIQNAGNLYVIGGAVSTGWDNGKAQRMTKTDGGKFVWKGLLKQGDFKFIETLGTWTPAYTAPNADEPVTVGTSQTINHIDGFDNDYKFVISREGWYEVTVDTENMTMTVNETEPVAATDVWMEGSAVPDGVALMNATNGNMLCYAGALKKGSLTFYTTDPTTSEKTYIVPSVEDADILDGGDTRETTDVGAQGWNVMIADNCYKIKLDRQKNTVSTMRFATDDNLYIIGGATSAGWTLENALPFTRDAQNPFLFTMVVELKVRNEFVESNLFKILGQKDWGRITFTRIRPARIFSILRLS